MDYSSATPRIVERILLGAEEDKRQLQDSPILGDVWLAYAHDPGGLQDLLITPHRETTGPRLAKEIRMRLLDKADRSAVTARVAYLQGLGKHAQIIRHGFDKRAHGKNLRDNLHAARLHPWKKHKRNY